MLICQTMHDGGRGFAVRDHPGALIAAGEGSLSHVDLEAQAMQHAVHHVTSLGMDWVVLETECLELKQALSNTGYDLSTSGALVKDLKSMLLLSFDVYCTECIHRKSKDVTSFCSLGVWSGSRWPCNLDGPFSWWCLGCGGQKFSRVPNLMESMCSISKRKKKQRKHIIQTIEQRRNLSRQEMRNASTPFWLRKLSSREVTSWLITL